MLKSKFAGFRPAPPVPVKETRFIPSETSEGTIVTEKVIDLTDPDAVPLPTKDEYTLENLIAAGVRLDEVPSTVLTPTDVDTINSALAGAIESINSKNNE